MQWPDNLKNSIQKEAAGKETFVLGKKRVNATDLFSDNDFS